MFSTFPSIEIGYMWLMDIWTSNEPTSTRPGRSPSLDRDIEQVASTWVDGLTGSTVHLRWAKVKSLWNQVKSTVLPCFFFTTPVGQGLKLRKELCVFGKLSGMPAISCASCHSLSIFNHLQAVDTQISQISDTSDNFIGHVMSGVGTAKHWRVCFGIFGGDISPSIGWVGSQPVSPKGRRPEDQVYDSRPGHPKLEIATCSY